MVNLLYVAVPLAVAILVSILWTMWASLTARARSRRSLEGGIDEFARELSALSPQREHSAGRSWRAKGQ